jgi:hypothetical protein
VLILIIQGCCSLHIPKSFLKTEENIRMYKSFMEKEPNLMRHLDVYNVIVTAISDQRYDIYSSKQEYDTALTKIRKTYLNESYQPLPSKEVTSCIRRYTVKLMDGRFVILHCIPEQLEKLELEYALSVTEESEYDCPLCGASYFNGDCPCCRMTLYG